MDAAEPPRAPTAGAPASDASAAALDADEELPIEPRPRPWLELSGFSISCLVHFCLILALAFLGVAVGGGQQGVQLMATADLDPLDDELVPEAPLAADTTNRSDPTFAELTVAVPQVSPVLATPATGVSASPLLSGTLAVGRNELSQYVPQSVGGGLAGRRRGPLRDGLIKLGASPESEAAVARGLRWLAAHQLDDGGWDFDHTKSICRGLCPNPGEETSRTAATALALLAFLGDGQTPREGEYQENIRRGLYFMSRRARVEKRGINLMEGTMYSQGISTLALCEAYAMTEDRSLRDLCDGAVRFVVAAQDPKGGGWRYMPGEPGDTTVTGWQLMALKSGLLGRLSVPSPTLGLANRFLDSVQSEGGARYGYMSPPPRNGTTAVGLLCRMYLGWPKDHPGLVRGVAHLAEWGPSDNDLYYDYYATQVMCHWQGPLWEAWNPRMRDYLVSTQATASHAAGSWFFPKDHGATKGGRLYCTALAIMTLEVYYRYMPLYRETASGGLH